MFNVFTLPSQGYKGSKGDMGMPGASGEKGTTGLPGLPVRIYIIELFSKTKPLKNLPFFMAMRTLQPS